MKNYRCFFFLYMGSTTWLAHDNAGICRTRASKQAKQSKARRRRLGREAEETRARSVASQTDSCYPASSQWGGRAGSLSIHVFAFYIFGRGVGRVPGVGSAVRTPGSSSNRLNRGSEPDGHGSRWHRGFWNRNWNRLRTGSEWI